MLILFAAGGMLVADMGGGSPESMLQDRAAPVWLLLSNGTYYLHFVRTVYEPAPVVSVLVYDPA